MELMALLSVLGLMIAGYRAYQSRQNHKLLRKILERLRDRDS